MSPHDIHPMDAAIAAEWASSDLEAAREPLRPVGVCAEVIRAVEISMSPHQVLASLRSAAGAAAMDLNCINCVRDDQGRWYVTDYERRRIASALAEVRSALRMIEALRVGTD